MAINKSTAASLKLSNLSLSWKIILLFTLVMSTSLVAGFSYFAYQNYWLNVQTALGGLMNFTDAKQQGVIRFIDQNEKLAKQLANLAGRADATTLRSQFNSVVTTDVFRLEDHPFKQEIIAQTRTIPTWKVYHAIDYVVRGHIVVSSNPLREGQKWDRAIDLKSGYSDPYYDDAVPVMTFSAATAEGTLYVHADARMLSNIINGEIGNLAGDMGAFYLAGVGKTFDYYIVNKDNLLITESRVRPGQFLKGYGSEHPWRTTLQQAGVICGKNGRYTTDAKCTTGCREAMGFYIGSDGKKMLGTSMPFYDSQWTIVVEEDANELLMPMWLSLAQVFGILCLIGIFSAYLFSRLVNKFISVPIHSLQEAINDIKDSGNFDKIVQIDSGDEIGELGHAFNGMSKKLNNLYRSLEDRVDERTKDLNVANEQLLEEIDEREHVEKALRENSEYMQVAAVAFETHEAIMITDANSNIVRVNQAFKDITGYSAEEAIGKTPRILSSGCQSKAFYADMWLQMLNQGRWAGEIWDKRKNGEIYPKWMTITAVKNGAGETTEYVAIFNDITTRKLAEDEIRNLAFYDALTGLPNRRLLIDRLTAAL
ncbi:MAG: PAS domain S-box protein, partial [Gallionellaceae bacterium]